MRKARSARLVLAHTACFEGIGVAAEENGGRGLSPTVKSDYFAAVARGTSAPATQCLNCVVGPIGSCATPPQRFDNRRFDRSIGLCKVLSVATLG